jgi:Ca2+-binding EF-hand superfamily protein
MNKPMTTIWTIAAIVGFSSLTACSGAELEGETATELSSHTESLTLADTDPGTRSAAREGRGRAGKERFFERLDANKNGTLEVAELPEHKREHFTKLDADRNGVISKEELASGHNGHKGKRHFDPERFDANKNGTIELSEAPEKMKEQLSKADSNADGILSADELRAQGKAFMLQRLTSKDANKDGALTAEEAGERKWSKLSLADADKDGKVTFAEIEQAREAGTLKRKGH